MSTTRQVILSPDAPPAIGPYSQGIKAGGFIFSAGQVALVRDTGKLVEGGIEEQTEQVIKNLQAVLAAQKLDLSAVVKTTVFLSDMKDFIAMNGVYGKYFASSPPARSTVEVSRLPKDALVEIDVVAVAP
jgi:2-iminobutanoate/2-iminopropanoate deaminase